MSLIKWKKDELFPAFNTMWGDFLNRDFINKSLELGTSIPAANISETETSYNLEIAAPGLNKEDFEIRLDNGVLTISSEKENRKEEKVEKTTRTEFSYSSFSRSFRIPENVKKSDISAEYKDGLLKLVLPKSEPSIVDKKKTIEIK